MAQPPDRRGPVLLLVLLVLAALVLVAWDAGREGADGVAAEAAAPPPAPALAPAPTPTARATARARPRVPVRTELPGGGTRVFGGHRFLVAYYGTARTPALGVLGESAPDVMDRRLRHAAAPFARPGRPVRPVYELIVTIADGHPGPDGDFSHDLPRADVRRYIAAAHRHGALLLLDVQPGRTDFTTVARRWEWALRDPAVGLALDPEWRMGPRQVPARTVGHVGAAEVNRTSAWLARLTSARGLPEKLFVVHQFRVDMVRHVERVAARPGLAMVQHVDGFGTRRQKLDTYRAIARPRQFTMGFKLFYDEDVHRMGARDVQRIRPTVRFVSFQ